MSDSEFLKQFDTWIELAKNDPEGFEALRDKMVSEQITDSPDEFQHRLKQLQWRIEGIRRRHSDKNDKSVEFARLLSELLKKQQALLIELAHACVEDEVIGRKLSQNTPAIEDTDTKPNKSDKTDSE